MADTLKDDPYPGLQSSSEEEEEEVQETEEPVQTLISGRAKRSTAGLHMSALLEAAADDDLALLFEEVEDDNEFAEDAEAAEEEDMRLDSSSDEDDDQGPNAPNDLEGEKQLQKEERKKRRAQNDLRFQTLRKRVKIDPTAVSAVPPPRPKKKSERISWLPTLEDGPTRTSSRRQTMENKEVTHARLKDSQEKRIRIIATMKEAEKRKAHLKPKQMTQEDHLAEAARIERLNSKSVNRWEAAEKRRAQERKAKIEALQNRRLDGPVISYWSGLATWVNGRLTRVGKADIKAKPEKSKSEKDDPKKKKKEEQLPLDIPAHPEGALAPMANGQSAAVLPSDQKASPSSLVSVVIPAPTAPAPPAPSTVGDAKPDDQATGSHPAADSTGKDENKSADTPAEIPVSTAKPFNKYPIPVVEIPAPRKSDSPATNKSPSPKLREIPSRDVDAMDVDQSPPQANVETEALQRPAPNQPNPPTATSADTPTVSGEVSQTSIGPSTMGVTLPPAPAPATSPLSSRAPLVIPADAAPLHTAPPEMNVIQGPQPGSALPAPLQSHEMNGLPAQPEVPPLPPVIEHTGRNLTILENFDDKTAHSKKYSIYFNARKPPRLTSKLLCIRQTKEQKLIHHRNLVIPLCHHLITISIS